jgi:hypothetical protein
MLELEYFYPIDRDMLKEKWDAAMNIPNNEWELRGIDEAIDIINNPELPHILRLTTLNMLPAVAVELLILEKL